jgi:glycosyltransferase involved in cell wall biosynthesis
VKVLILHQHFNTPDAGGPLRSYYIAKALIERGMWPVIVTTHSDSKYKVEISEGMEVHYLPIPYKNHFGFYRRSWSFLRYVFGAISLSKKFKDAKVVYAMSVPLTIGLAAIAIKKFYRIPYIFEVGDLWPDAPIEMGFIKSGLFKGVLRKLEKRIYSESFSIVALSDAIAEKIRMRTNRPVVVIPNMADVDFFSKAFKPATFGGNANKSKFVISYVGAVGYANGLESLLEFAARSLTSLPEVHFQICGRGAMLEQLKTRAKELSLSNLSFIPFQNREGVFQVLSNSDASFISYRHEGILETGSPNKYFDALAAGKPVIVNFEGWIKTEVENFSCGLYVDPKNPDTFPAKLSTWLQSPGVFADAQRNARMLAETRYDRKILSSTISETILSVRV